MDVPTYWSQLCAENGIPPRRIDNTLFLKLFVELFKLHSFAESSFPVQFLPNVLTFDT